MAAPVKGASKRDAKASYTAAIPLRQGEVEEDFEHMSTDVAKYAPNLDIDLEVEVAPNKRLRPVESVRPSVRLDAPPPGSGKRKCAHLRSNQRSRVPRAVLDGCALSRPLELGVAISTSRESRGPM